MTDWMQQMREADEQRRKEAQDKATEAAATFRAQGYTRAVFQYDGSDDSGNIEAPTLYKGDDEADALTTTYDWKEPGQVGALVDYAYAVLESVYGGWEINEGGFGELHLDLATLKGRIEHNQRIESTHYDEEEF